MIVNRTITPPSETPSPISSTIQLTTKRLALATAPAASREHTRRFASACVQASIHIKKKNRIRFSTSSPPSCSCSTCQPTYSHTTISDDTFRQCEIKMYSFYLALTSLEHDWIMTHNHGEQLSCPTKSFALYVTMYFVSTLVFKSIIIF